jgi:hypothetical protein
VTNDVNRALLARISNLIRALASHHIHISDVTINVAWDSAIDHQSSELLDPKVQSFIAKQTRVKLAELHNDF